MFILLGSTRTLIVTAFGEVGLRLVILVLLLMVFVAWPGGIRLAWGQAAAAQPSLSFISNLLILQIKEDEKRVPAQVIVRNDSARSADLRFSAVVRDSN